MRGKRTLRLAAIALAFLALPSRAPAALRFSPYLQSLEAGTVSVCAFIDADDSLRARLLEPGGTSRDVDAVGEDPACAELDGLLPNVDYHYNLFVNGECVTGPDPIAFTAWSDPEQTFVIYGDTRSGDDSFDLAHRRVVRAIEETVVADAVIHTGDFVEEGGDPLLWENFFRIEDGLLASTPIFPAVGRSDQPGTFMREAFQLLAESPWYSFDRGCVHVAVLNVWQARSQPAEEVGAEGRQVRWLREDLAGARARGVRYCFVVLHEPVIDIDGKSSSFARTVLMPLFEAFDVTAVFSGAHFFSHAVAGGVHYFTNGGGGAILDGGEPKEGTFRFFDAVHHFLVLEIDRFRARVRAVNAYGEDFYHVTLEGPRDPFAPTYTRSYPGGKRSAGLTVFYEPGCEACDAFEADLFTEALRAGATLTVTFKSLEDAGNRSELATWTDREGPVPIVVVAGEVLAGRDEIDKRLNGAIERAADRPMAESPDPVRRAAPVAAAAAGALLLGLLWRWKGRRPNDV